MSHLLSEIANLPSRFGFRQRLRIIIQTTTPNHLGTNIHSLRIHSENASLVPKVAEVQKVFKLLFQVVHCSELTKTLRVALVFTTICVNHFRSKSVLFFRSGVQSLLSPRSAPEVCVWELNQFNSTTTLTSFHRISQHADRIAPCAVL
jgi:hypothetical protein